ncbi:MAG TPA: hypothetical protein PLU30_17490 [Verrucomicrobiae bacterium]|nr:hypothetical protein [Verrucomicrobiae bacterium]
MRACIAWVVWGLACASWAGDKRAEDYVMEVTLTRPVTLPVIVGDRQAGSAKLDVGKTLEVVDIAGDSVLVEAMGAVSPVPRDATDLPERLKKADLAGPTRRDLRDALKHGFALVGMTPGQVMRAIGPPQRQEKAGATMRWWYPVVGEVPRTNTMTIERGTPDTGPQIIPGGYRMIRGHHGTDYVVREPPVFYPGFYGESFQVRQETTEKAVVGEKLLTFEEGRLIRVTEQPLP